MRRIIFLDVDGVLIPYGWGDVKHFKPSCIAVFKDIVRLTGAVIVISSSWRLGEMDRLMALLKAEGLDSLVIGTTTCDVLRGPKTFRKDGEERVVMYNDSVSRSRPMEIREWLDQHPDVADIDCIAIDDEQNAFHRIVAPRSSVGLEPHHVQEALTLFQEK